MWKLLLIFVISTVTSPTESRAYMGNSVYDDSPIPPYTDYAKTARYLVHKAEWVAMGTISTLSSIKGYPMVNIISVADSERQAKSTGNIYYYLTMLDFTGQDLAKENKVTIMISNDQDLACSVNGTDPMEPTCARIMISGHSVKLDEGSDEYTFGKAAMLDRHPAAANWIKAHNFFLCKLAIEQIIVLDYYGGPHYVTYEDYMKADLDGDEILGFQDHNNIEDNKAVVVRFNPHSNVKRVEIIV